MTMISSIETKRDIPLMHDPFLKTPICKSTLLLLGSYFIALILTTAVHEIGHGLALSSISIGFRLVLNPFSLSMAQPLSPVPLDSLLFVAAAGTAMELLFGSAIFLLLWRFRNPHLAPLLMCVPVSFLSSGGYFLAGVSVADGDTALMISLGVPAILIQVLGILFVILGAVSLLLLFPLLGITPEVSFKRLFVILFVGMTLHGFGMIAFALAFNPLEISIGIANVISMLVSVTIFAGVYVKKSRFFDRISHTEVAILNRTTITSILVIALIIIIAELSFFNLP